MNKAIPFLVVALVVAIAAFAYLYAYTPETQRAQTNSTGTNTRTSTSTGGNPPLDSGIHGTVTLGPTCPVERTPPDPNCANKPFQTLVVIFPLNDPVHAIRFINSNASGTFSTLLPPGEYTLGAGESNLPRCDHPLVTILPHTFASTTISCDTGIR